MKKKVIIGFISLAFTTLIFNSNVNSQEVFSNAEALEYADSDATTVYCCSPYTKTCISGGPGRPDTMGVKQTTKCPK